MPRERDCEPVSQVLEHPPQPPHEATAQLTGQGFVLHDLFCVVAGQALPPFFALRVMRRVRLCVPEPQFLEQPPYPPHDDTVQSTGQAFVLHEVTDFVFSHFFPPNADF